MKKEEVLDRLASVLSRIASIQETLEELLDDQETLHHGEHAMLSTAYKVCDSAHTYVERVLHSVERHDVRIPDDATELSRTDGKTVHVWVEDRYYHLCERSYTTDHRLASIMLKVTRVENILEPCPTSVTLGAALQADGSVRYGLTVSCDNRYATWDSGCAGWSDEGGWNFEADGEGLTAYYNGLAIECIWHAAPLIPGFAVSHSVEQLVADFASHFKQR